MSRDEIIQQLLIETLHQIVERGRTNWLMGILEHGFSGYANLNETDLAAAARRFGIAARAEAEETRNDETSPNDDEDFEHDAELAFMERFAGLPGSLAGNWALDSD